MEEAMTNADLIVRTLREAGVTHGFGVPSGNVLPLLEAMRSGGLPFVLTAHEGSAAFSPLLAATCNLPPAQLGRRLQMAIDHRALFGPLTKASLALRRGRVAPVLAEALEIALGEPPGPVHVDL